MRRFACFCVLAMASVSWAQSPAEDAAPIVDNEGIFEQWSARQRALLPNKTGGFRRANAFFLGALSENGVHGQPGGAQAFDLAHAALGNSVSLKAAGDLEGAVVEAELAVRLAPDLPSAHARLAELRLAQKDPGGLVGSLGDYVKSVERNPWIKTAFLARFAVALAITFVFALLLVAVIFVARSFRLLTFDVLNALPRGASRWQIQLVLIAVLALPLVVQAGPLITAVSWLLLAFLYLSRRERAVVLLLVVAAAASPFGARHASGLWTWFGTPHEHESRAILDVGAMSIRDQMRSSPERSQLAECALGLEAIRGGDAEDARARWSTIARTEPSAWARTNHGVSLAMSGEEDAALKEFTAVMSEPDANAAAYNAAEIFVKQGRLDDAERAKALIKDPEVLERFRAITFRSADEEVTHNRAWVLANVPLDPLSTAFAERDSTRWLRRELGRVLFMGFGDEIAAGVFGLVALLLVVFWKLSRSLMPSRACSRCGAPASERYDGADVPRDTCSACFHAFVHRGAPVEAGMKLRKEKQVIAHQRRKRRVARWLSLPLPGFGHLYSGATLRGAALALLSLLTAGLGIALLSPIPWPELEGWQRRELLLALPIGVYSIIAVLSFWRAGRLHEEA